MFKLKIAWMAINAVASTAGAPIVASSVWTDSATPKFEDKNVLEKINMRLQNSKINLTPREKDLFDLNSFLSSTFDKERIGSEYYRMVNKWTPLTTVSKQGRDYFRKMMNSRFRSISNIDNIEDEMLLIQEKVFDDIEDKLESIIKGFPLEEQKEFNRATYEIIFSFGFLKGTHVDIIAFFENGTHRGWEYIKIDA